jgi:hypothetical protein
MGKKIIKLLYNSYHFTVPEENPHKINSGVAQGSLISPILYDWYVNDLVSTLSRKFGFDHTFAYADDIALICLGLSDIQEGLRIIEEWAAANGAQVNKNKCGILRVSGRETPLERKSFDGVPFVHRYQYLGVPLDQAFTLKHLVALLKGRIQTFNSRIGRIPAKIVGLKTNLTSGVVTRDATSITSHQQLPSVVSFGSLRLCTTDLSRRRLVSRCKLLACNFGSA